VLSCALWETRERARACLKGDIRLSFCGECGHIQNDVFDENATEYSARYENALHFSRVYQDYARSEAERIVGRLGLRNKDVVEVGSGDGRFISLLCELGDNRARGFDPSYSPDKAIDGFHPGVSIVSEYYGEKHRDVPCDLIVSRHVLEHIPRPSEFMQTLRRAVGTRADTNLAFEVPSALYLIQDLSLWDLIYEHCSYFTRPSLARLFSQTGFGVDEIRVTFMNQCLAIDASSGSTHSPSYSDEVSTVARHVEEFKSRAPLRLERCLKQIDELGAEGKRVALWGSGARAVIYLNMLGFDRAQTVACAVDINPRKHGAFLPGTAQEVVAPDQLPAFRPDVVLFMNPIYANEIGASLKERGVEAELVLV
jgi:SAM-dependent methyltransferase